jgi:Arc/MetJ-type ribon-helix-helix transcriptional regulator
MSTMLSTRISDGMKAEIEIIVREVGLWKDQSHFIKEALNEHIKKYWNGERFDC